MPGSTLLATAPWLTLVVLALPAPLGSTRGSAGRTRCCRGLGVVVQRHHGARPDARGQRGHDDVDQGPGPPAAPGRSWLLAVADDVARTPAAPGPAWRRSPGSLAAGSRLPVAARLAVAAGLPVAAWLTGLARLAVAARGRVLAERGGRLPVARLPVLGLAVLGLPVRGLPIGRLPGPGLPVPRLAERGGGLVVPGLPVSGLRVSALRVSALPVPRLTSAGLGRVGLGRVGLAAKAQAREAVLGLGRSWLVLPRKAVVRKPVLRKRGFRPG